MIYILDDEKDLLVSMCKRVQLRGFQVTGFESAPPAIQAISSSNSKCEMILVDYTMPGSPQSGGQKLWQELKTLSPAPLYVMSGYGQGNPEIEKLLASGKVSGIFYKPVPLDELILTIESLGIQKNPPPKS